MNIKAVFFDLGETLLDETRMWNEWADFIDVPRPQFFAALDDTIARGEHHHRAFERFGVDPKAAQRARVDADTRYLFSRDDLYPDAAECLTALRNAGLFVGIAGNQSRDLLPSMLSLGLSADVITTSEHLGFDKPSPRFFEALLAQTGFQAAETAYVGDRIDNDVLPAKAIGMCAVFLERGLWGRRHAQLADAARADVRIATLTDLPDALREARG